MLSFVWFYSFSLQFSYHRNQPTELGYSHTYFEVPSNFLLPVIHNIHITLFHFLNQILYSNERRGAKQRLQRCHKGELQLCVLPDGILVSIWIVLNVSYN